MNEVVISLLWGVERFICKFVFSKIMGYGSYVDVFFYIKKFKSIN